jgi:hypothetical protein
VALRRARAGRFSRASPVDPVSVENLSNQIRLMNKAVKRDLSIDKSLNDWLIFQLATLLDAAGTQSTLDLVYYSNQAQNLSFFYDQKTAHVFTTDIVNSAAYNAGVNGGAQFTVLSRDGRERDNIYLFFTKDGFPVFWNISEDTGSTWADVRTGLIFVGSIVLSVVGVPIASQLGGAVLGTEMAATYPALAQGIGQAAMSTLMNGGDIEKGVTSAVASYVGAGVGGQVASTTGSDIIGQATAAATRAYINDGDIQSAVLQSLVQNGVSNVQTLFLSAAPSPTFDVTFDQGSQDLTALGDLKMGDYYTDENGITYGLDAQGDLTVVDFVDDQGIGYYTDAQGDTMVADTTSYSDLNQTYDASMPTTDVAQTAPIGGSGSTFNSSMLTSLATTALSLVGAYVKAGAPAIRTGTANSTVNANGTVTTRNANGTTTVTKPAVGTPYVTSGGSVITNNGDGTYSVVNANGQITTKSYTTSNSSGLGGIDPKMLFAGVAVLAILTMRK